MTKTIYYHEHFDATAPLNVDKLYIEHMPDESPDLSYLGEYSNTPAAVHIDRKERGEQGRNEYRYFNLGHGDADYIEQDYKRYEAYNRGEWYCIGIQAVAVVSYPTGNGNRRLETFASSVLWGIESDSDKNHMGEVEREQLNELKSHLEAFNIPLPELQPA
jgi:hypothetical protein